MRVCAFGALGSEIRTGVQAEQVQDGQTIEHQKRQMLYLMSLAPTGLQPQRIQKGSNNNLPQWVLSVWIMLCVCSFSTPGFSRQWGARRVQEQCPAMVVESEAPCGPVCVLVRSPPLVSAAKMAKAIVSHDGSGERDWAVYFVFASTGFHRRRNPRKDPQTRSHKVGARDSICVAARSPHWLPLPPPKVAMGAAAPKQYGVAAKCKIAP